MRNFDYEIRDICKQCKHYSGWEDWELGVEYLRCGKYSEFCGKCKHRCRKLKRELIDKIRMERNKRK